MTMKQYESKMLLVGNPENRRVTMFQDTLLKSGHSSAAVISYLDLLQRRTNLCDILTPGMDVRVESPGENFEVERELLRLGFADAKAEGCVCIDPATLDTMHYDHGRILCHRQWYLGLTRFLRSLRNLPCRFMNAPDDIHCMFDKTETHRRCQASSIPVPPSINSVQSFDELITAMSMAGWDRVFIKLAYGSSASGVGALHRLKDGTMRLATTTEMVCDHEGLKLYNSLKPRTYTNPNDIAKLIDEWCRHYVHVEKWLPKVGQDGYPCDLRIVMIGGEPAHLGLCNSEYSDKLAKALAEAPIMDSIETLDLSSGTLGDEGVEALLASSKLTKLKKLDVHHHYLSDDCMKKLAALSCEVNLEDQEEADDNDDRYVAVSE